MKLRRVITGHLTDEMAEHHSHLDPAEELRAGPDCYSTTYSSAGRSVSRMGVRS
jgi:hypothetical protein